MADKREMTQMLFRWEHLPEEYREIAQPLAELATLAMDTLPAGRARDETIQNLLEAQQCAFRALRGEGAGESAEDLEAQLRALRGEA